MPYDDCLFIFELVKSKLSRYCKLKGNRAFIMQAIIHQGNDSDCWGRP